MTDQPKRVPDRTQPATENLELNREVVQDLGEGEAESAEGGARGAPDPKPVTYKCPPPYTHTPSCDVRKSLVFFCR